MSQKSLTRPVSGPRRPSISRRTALKTMALSAWAAPGLLGAAENAPRPHVEAENRTDHDSVRRPDPSGPHRTGVQLADAVPITPVDPEGGRPPGRSARPVNAADRSGLDAYVVAERGCCRLSLPQLRLSDDGKLHEVVESAHRVR